MGAPANIGVPGRRDRRPGRATFFVPKGPVGWLPFLTLTDLPAVLERARAAGGRVVFPLPDDDSGRVAAVFDPSETRLGLYQPEAPTASTGGTGLEGGLVVWIEQKTRDQKAGTTLLSASPRGA